MLVVVTSDEVVRSKNDEDDELRTTFWPIAESVEDTTLTADEASKEFVKMMLLPKLENAALVCTEMVVEPDEQAETKFPFVVVTRPVCVSSVPAPETVMDTVPVVVITFTLYT